MVAARLGLAQPILLNNFANALVVSPGTRANSLLLARAQKLWAPLCNLAIGTPIRNWVAKITCPASQKAEPVNYTVWATSAAIPLSGGKRMQSTAVLKLGRLMANQE